MLPIPYKESDLDLSDRSYDGETNYGLSVQFGGLGQLADGIIGPDDFKKSPFAWIGWNRDDYGKNLIYPFLPTSASPPSH